MWKDTSKHLKDNPAFEPTEYRLNIGELDIELRHCYGKPGWFMDSDYLRIQRMPLEEKTVPDCQTECLNFAISKMTCDSASYEKTLLAISELESTQNIPLTAEELRAMQSEPAWIQTIGPIGEYGPFPGWCLITQLALPENKSEPFSICRFGTFHLDLNAMGKTWLAFRRPVDRFPAVVI